MEKYKFLEHTADVKFQAFGENLEEVFSNCVLAMFNTMSEDKVKEVKNFEVNVEGKDLPSLLYNFLEELLFLFDSEEFMLSSVKKIKIDEKNFVLDAQVIGDTAEKYEIHLDVKAVTYNDMFVHEEKGKWVSQVVLDV